MSTKTTKRKRTSARATERAPASAASNAPVAPTAAAADVSVPASAVPTIALAARCTVKDAAALKDELLKLLDVPAAVAIDARSVERIDTAIMQLLCAFVRGRTQRGSSVTWEGVPQPLRDAARLLGIGPLLALPQEANT